MRATLVIGTLLLMAACAEQTSLEPPPTGASSVKSSGQAPSRPDPCDRSDFPAGAAGDAAYANCVIQS